MIKKKKNIININIEKELKQSYLDYAMSVIIGRALPDIRDGLKPVHRRIIYAMKMMGNDYNKNYKKSARIVGDVIGKYHPHGDIAVYDTIVRMAQSFSLRYTLIEGQGNFGSIDGDSAAAMRYTEIRMSKISHELLKDLEKNTVNFIKNYDNTEFIPEVLPTRIPNLLINGSTGIAVGMATNIPPHNIKEIINGCIACIENKNIKIKELMKYIKGPDFPTAAIVNSCIGIKKAYRTGKGKILIRANHIIEINKKTNIKSIIINELPYQVNKAKLIEKINSLVKNKNIEGIFNLRDESDKDGMRILINLKKHTSSKIVLNNLHSLTKLQIYFGINMVALNKGKPQTLNLKEIIDCFLQHRKEIVINRSIFELKKIKKNIHKLKGLIIAIFNIEKIINLIKNTNEIKSVKKKLISEKWYIKNNDKIKLLLNKNIYDSFIINNKNKKYYLTYEQVKSILDLKLYKLTNLEYSNLLKEYYKLKLKSRNLKKIIKCKKKLMFVIKEELLKIKNDFGDKRKTKIKNFKFNLKQEDLIQKEDVVITLSNKGYIKYQLLSLYVAQHRGGRGKIAVKVKNQDFIEKLLVTNTHNTILCFSSFGIIYWLKVNQLPKSDRYSVGKPIKKFLNLKNNEKITAILSMSFYSNIFKKKIYIFMATSWGIVKKTLLTAFMRPRCNGIRAIKLNKNDKLAGVSLVKDNNNIMLFSSYGKVVRFIEKEVRVTGRVSTGMIGMKLNNNDKIVSLIIINNKKINSTILTITEKGYGKRTNIINYPIKSRATKGVVSIKVNKRNGLVVSSTEVLNNDQVMIITNMGILLRIKVIEIKVIGRNTQGVILIKTLNKENVVSLQKISL
ncbi:DNA topoisomerase (ATP-hydrolyzing) subunit A [Candidatus Annandia pinicola]|uniref:DNA topoisomerase (ATP-hydrolyzing) subunit A n=1 Tax=Candidatus Annandia pinicola TaxID=1345117 RepID=UPI001D001C49|nr:DNA topoisomerase (ATP-hydrolyzing) subunit A [Candidatus Annandia pinicola]UDG80314.1 DNA gyrase subunit A [Candidatus Annandia pinicola]